MRRVRMWAAAGGLLAAAACSGKRGTSDVADGAGRSGTGGRSGGRSGAEGGESGTDDVVAGGAGAGTSGGSAGRGGDGGAAAGGKGGTAGGRTDLYCEGDESDCQCITDPNDVRSTEGIECTGSTTAYCCADDAYPASGTCNCVAWSCSDNGSRCSCSAFSAAGEPSCSSNYARCCLSPITNNCMCDHSTAECLDTEIAVPSCTVDRAQCLAGDERVNACRDTSAGGMGGTGGDGGSSGTGNAGGPNGGAGSGGNASAGAAGASGNAGENGNAGAGGNAGSGGGTGGAGGVGGAPSVACDASFAVGADGFVRAPAAGGICWFGYASPGGDAGSNVMPTSFGACGTNCMLRVSGTVGPATLENSYAGMVYVGFAIRQSAGSSMRSAIAPAGTSLVVRWTNAGASPNVRVQLSAGSTTSTRWCAPLGASPAMIPYATFNTQCSDNLGAVYAKQPIDTVQLVIPGGETVSPFDVTILSVGEI